MPGRSRVATIASILLPVTAAVGIFAAVAILAAERTESPDVRMPARPPRPGEYRGLGVQAATDYWRAKGLESPPDSIDQPDDR